MGRPSPLKLLLVGAVALLASPSLASAEVTLTIRDVPLHPRRALAGSTPTRFNMVGLHWRGTGSVEFRTRSITGRWSAWHKAAPEAEDVPDAFTSEARAAQSWRLGNPYWTGESNGIAYRTRGPVVRLRAYFMRSPEIRIPLRRLSIAGSPPLLTRAAWGANESIRKGSVQYAPSVQFAVVHHTAGANSYTAAQSAAIVRGIYTYHVKGNGWNDIGYNFLVDRYGRVFEGRFGGVERNVIGAHAEGFNTGSSGVAILGTYGSAAPPALARNVLANLLAWRLDLAHVDPMSTLLWTSGGNARYTEGVPVTLRAVSGHKDTGFTSCPGAALYAQLGAIARQAAATGLPKLYAPTVPGALGGQIRFQARLTEVLSWTVSVTDAAGLVVAGGAGTSQDVDWTWDSATATPGQYTWRISAGETVRAASGTVGARPVPLALRSATASPKIVTPNGDGQTDASQISYTLSAPATVTATLRSPGGSTLATLFTQQRQPGKQTFRFTASGVPDGRYEIVLSATDGKATVTAVVPLLVDRTVRRFSAAPVAFSPNGDGVKDDLTFAFELTRAASVRLEIAQSGKTVMPVYVAELRPGSQRVAWNATGTKDGTYAGVLTATSDIGAVAHTSLFRIDTVRPKLTALSFRGLRFRVSEAATVRLTVDGRLITRTVKAGVFSFRAGGVRSVRIVARDAAGNPSRTLRYR